MKFVTQEEMLEQLQNAWRGTDDPSLKLKLGVAITNLQDQMKDSGFDQIGDQKEHIMEMINDLKRYKIQDDDALDDTTESK